MKINTITRIPFFGNAVNTAKTAKDNNKNNTFKSSSYVSAPNLAPLKQDVFESKTSVRKTQNAKSSAQVINPRKDFEETQKSMREAKMDWQSAAIAIEAGLDVEKVKSIAKSISDNDTRLVTLRKSKFDSKNNFIIKAVNGDKDTKLNLVDKNLNILAQEETKLNDKGNKKLVQTMDYRTNTFDKILMNKRDDFNIFVVDKQIKIKRDKQGRLIRKETIEQSEIPGMYNVKYDFPNGKSRVLSSATVDKKTGNVLITKDMRSADMTRTQYRYEDDPDGNRIMEYKVTTPNGKVLMNQSQTFEKVADNKFRSTRNDKSFLVELTDKSIDVTDENKKEKFQIPTKGFIKGNEKKVMNMLKTIPGDELINMAGSVVMIEEIPDRLDSYCQTKFYNVADGKTNKAQYMTGSTLAISDDAFVFLHELGHATDMGGKDVDILTDRYGNPIDAIIKDALNNDKEFVKNYNEERKNYLNEFPPSEREFVGYFLEEEAVRGQKDRGRKETIAETNAILNTYQTVDLLGIRTQYLQQHFPKTIAYLSTKLTQDK
ncbi:hypothetical protein IJ818_01710 [bacterium]|nr:hypothetical protein [bacterium]